MPVESLPSFNQALERAKGAFDSATLSESHGFGCGFLCRQQDATPSDFITQLVSFEAIEGSDNSAISLMEELFVTTVSQLADEQYRFELFLPGDDETLEDRTISLAHWCTGFLAGLGTTQGDWVKALSEDASEALGDIEQIARAEFAGEGSDEEDETALAEIVEYLRVVCLTIREELRPPGPDDQLH